MLDQKLQEKFQKIRNIIIRQEQLEKELVSLLSGNSASSFNREDFVHPGAIILNKEIVDILGEAGKKGISKKEIIYKIQRKFPNYNLDKHKMTNALAYLKKTGKISNPVHGIYTKNL